MKVHVHVTVKSKKECVERVGLDKFLISLKEPPAENIANKKIFTLLKYYFPKQRIILKNGAHSSNKLFEII